jgi:hypothetical protein
MNYDFYISVSHEYFYGAEKLVLPAINFTRFGKLVLANAIFGAKNIHSNDRCLYKFGKLVSPTVNVTCFGKLGSVTAIPISLSPKKICFSHSFLGK